MLIFVFRIIYNIYSLHGTSTRLNSEYIDVKNYYIIFLLIGL